MSPSRNSRARRGTAAVEFALLLPFLMMLFIGVAELVTYMRAVHSLERAAAEVVGAAARLEQATQEDVRGLFDAANLIAAPIRAWTTATTPPPPDRARTFISVVTNRGSGNEVSWTCARGDTTQTARLIAGTSSVTLPNGFVVPAGQTVIVVEIVNTRQAFAVFRVLFGPQGPPAIRTYAIQRPRQAQLSTLSQGCPA